MFAMQVIAGQWLFGPLTCDIFNANDVLFSTASLLHLCCISWDRYIAVTDPFNYERRMTRRRAALTLAAVWTASACLSHIPIHLGLYTTASQRDKLAAADSNECSFKVCLLTFYYCSTFQIQETILWIVYTLLCPFVLCLPRQDRKGVKSRKCLIARHVTVHAYNASLNTVTSFYCNFCKR